MTDLALPESDAVLLRRAGSLLDTVGRHANGDVAGAVECLIAVEHLTALGLDFTATAMSVGADDAVAAIKDALQLLAELSLAAFVLPEVVAATDAAQRAFLAGSRG